MTMVFDEKPNVVHVILADDFGQLSKFVVGSTINEIAASIGMAPTITEVKTKRKRRTKAQVAQKRPRNSTRGWTKEARARQSRLLRARYAAKRHPVADDVPPPHNSVSENPSGNGIDVADGLIRA